MQFFGDTILHNGNLLGEDAVHHLFGFQQHFGERTQMPNLFHGVTKYLQKEGAHFLVPEGCIAPYRALESHMPRILSHFGLRVTIRC